MTISISKQQMNMLAPFVLENYISELIIHCDASFPHLKKIMGEEKLRWTLKNAVDQAEKSGFTQKGPVQFYIDLMVIFGVGFETDPQYSWISASLNKNKALTQIEKTTILFHDVEKYLDEISGNDQQHLFQAANKLEQMSLENINISQSNFVEEIQIILKETYPQKFQLTQAQKITELIQSGIEKSTKTYGFEQANQVALIVILMLLLGHQFDEDPFYAWAAKEKIKKELVDHHHDAVAKKLEKRAKIWLQAVVKNEYEILNSQNNEGNHNGLC